MTADVLIVGSGLLGTSLGLALAATRDVLLVDASPDVLRRAVARGAGRVFDGSERVGLVVVATPPSAVARQLVDLQRQGVGFTYTHVCSVQAPVQREVEALGGLPRSFCGGHPMAGREVNGPDAATGDLFAGRPWAICPGPRTTSRAQHDVTVLARDVGAEPVQLDPDEHDAIVALVSHVPQLAASALAARLVPPRVLDPRPGVFDPQAMAVRTAPPLAGPGLQDSTRLAASDPDLWREVLTLNAKNIAPVLQSLADDLAAAAQSLREGQDGGAAVHDLLQRGRAGRELVPVKRGERGAAFATVVVSVTDAPGRLAALLTAAGEGGVNVEDVRVEHLTGRPTGVIELVVRTQAQEQARTVLRAAGWAVVR